MSTIATPTPLTLKITFSGDTRRFTLHELPSNLASFKTFLNAQWKELKITPDINIKYVDSENDLITIKSDQELIEAIRNAEMTNKILRIQLDSQNSQNSLNLNQSTTNNNSINSNPIFNNYLEVLRQFFALQQPQSTSSSTTTTTTTSTTSTTTQDNNNNQSSANDIAQMFERLNLQSQNISTNNTTVDQNLQFQLQLQDLIRTLLSSPLARNFLSFWNEFPDQQQQQQQQQQQYSPNGSPPHNFSPPRTFSAICDGCAKPIRGVRFKCQVCADYDLCERCEKDSFSIHDVEHKFTRLEHGKVVPTSTTSNGGHRRHNSIASQNSAFSPIAIARGLLCKFVEDITIPDGSIIMQNSKFRKTWKLQNVGQNTWPSETKLVFDSGHQLNAPNSIPISQQVPPGETIEISIDCEAPTQTGRYHSYWKLSIGNETFGPKIWLDFIVVTNEFDQQQRSIIEQQISPINSIPNNNNNSMEVETTNNTTSTTSTTSTTTTTTTTTTEQDIRQILDMGFNVNPELVAELLKKHGGDKQLVINEILSLL